jgi:isopentenyl diphosphate isomerase/L-lactate dehydrogenase-like FMN-dependent dehydrogenase
MIEGGTEEEQTVRLNRDAFREVGLRPRVLDSHAPRELRTRIFGVELAMPAFPTPAGFIRMAHHDGELGVARAAKSAGVPMGLGILSSVPIEDVIRVHPDTWFQLYMIGGREGSQVAMERAWAAGSRVLFVTVDFAAATGGRDRISKPRMVPGRVDVQTAIRYAPEMVVRPLWALNFLRGGLDLAFPNAPRTPQGEVLTAMHAATAIRDYPPTWDDLEWVRQQWPGKLVIKGIVTAEDARRAADIGADGVSVSNHGGNGLDTGPATLRALPEVVDAAAGRLTVLMDGGIRRGSDVVKALALGADAVMFGRPYFWALAAAGEAGVHQVMGLLRRGIVGTLMNLGVRSIHDLDASHLLLPAGFPVPGKAVRAREGATAS